MIHAVDYWGTTAATPQHFRDAEGLKGDFDGNLGAQPVGIKGTGEEDDGRHLAGNVKTAVTLFKSLLGPGMLFLPAGVKNAGLGTAMVVLVVIGAIVMRCILLLLRCERMLAAQGPRTPNGPNGNVRPKPAPSIGRKVVPWIWGRRISHLRPCGS